MEEFHKKVIRKPVAFNTTDKAQAELLRYALTLDNYSGHMKKLLAKDYQEHKKEKEIIAQHEAKKKQQEEKPSIVIKKNGGGVKIDLTQKVNKDSNSSTDESSNQ